VPTTSSSPRSPAGFAAALSGVGLLWDSTTTAPTKTATASTAAAAAKIVPNDGLQLGRSRLSGERSADTADSSTLGGGGSQEITGPHGRAVGVEEVL
jgi:hypothetical protein